MTMEAVEKWLAQNLAPADLRKEGPAFDLPIALSIVVAHGQCDAEALAGYLIAGELSLDGSLRPVHGVLPMAIAAREHGLRGVIVFFALFGATGWLCIRHLPDSGEEHLQVEVEF